MPTASVPYQSPNTVAPKNVSTWKRVVVTAVIVGVILSVWNFVIRPALSGGGGVSLDSALVEQNIKAEYTKNGYDVKVECPDPMGGNVGDKRNCLVTDTGDGSKVMAVVTIENAQGAITWVAQ
jgi:hypothetical protein